MFDVTERVRTCLYLLDSDNVISLTSPPVHFRVFACNECCLFLSSEMDEKLMEMVRKYEELYDMSNRKDRLCGLVVRVSGYRYRGPGFDSRRYQIF